MYDSHARIKVFEDAKTNKLKESEEYKNWDKIESEQAEKPEMVENELFNFNKIDYHAERWKLDKARMAIIKKKEYFRRVRQSYEKELITPAITAQASDLNFNEDFDIKFYSRMESGNLLRVVKVPVKTDLASTGFSATIKAEYDLYLEPDSMTENKMHWFYFKIFTKGLNDNVILNSQSRIRLNIRNMIPKLNTLASVFEVGMLPRFSVCDENGVPGKWKTSNAVT